MELKQVVTIVPSSQYVDFQNTKTCWQHWVDPQEPGWDLSWSLSWSLTWVLSALPLSSFTSFNVSQLSVRDPPGARLGAWCLSLGSNETPERGPLSHCLV